MKKPLALLTLVAISVAISGCGGNSSPKAAPLPPSQPYSGNGVSLKFPKSWQQIDVTGIGSFDLTKWIPPWRSTLRWTIPGIKPCFVTAEEPRRGTSPRPVPTATSRLRRHTARTADSPGMPQSEP